MSAMDDDGDSITVPRAGSSFEDRDGADHAHLEKERAAKRYKSWKKKYRKMRIVFDQKMEDGDELHKQEQKALATAKRIAIENDRILDLLLDNNESPQIPLDKRVDISMEPTSDPKAPQLEIDQPQESTKPEPTKSLKVLIKEVPHCSYTKAKEQFPEVVADMEPFEGEAHPPSFLTSDDVDDYLFEIDSRIAPNKPIPTLAPASRGQQNGHAHGTMSQNIALRNPTSVYNWLRKHAPKTFLQDGEASAAAADHVDHHPEEHVDGRKKRGTKGERGSGKAGARGGKRVSAAARAEKGDKGDKPEKTEKTADGWDASMEDDPDFGATPATARNKRKRDRDDDPGYRPKGSSTRPTKKKRKSDVEGTPTVSKRSRKSDTAAQSKDD